MTSHPSRRRQLRALAWYGLASLVALPVLVALCQCFLFSHEGSASFRSHLSALQSIPAPPPSLFSCTTCQSIKDDAFYCQDCEFERPLPTIKPLSNQTLYSHRFTFIEEYLADVHLLIDCRPYDSWCYGLMMQAMHLVLSSPPLFSPLSVILFVLFWFILASFLFVTYKLAVYLLSEQARITASELAERQDTRDDANRQLASDAVDAITGGSLFGVRQRMLTPPS